LALLIDPIIYVIAFRANSHWVSAMVQVMNLSPVTVQAGSVQIDANLASRQETIDEHVDVVFLGLPILCLRT
jgi:hypothetical protein